MEIAKKIEHSNSKEILEVCKQTRKGARQKKNSSTFKKCRFLTLKIKRISPAWQKAWKVEKSHPLVLNEK